MKIINSMLFLSILFFMPFAKAQNLPTDTTSNLVVTENVKIHDLVVQKRILNQKKTKEEEICIPYPKNGLVQGYKIQLNRFKSKATADDQIVRFLKIFPNIAASIRYEVPNYKVYVGRYLTEESMKKDLNRIRKKFRGSFSVQTPIYVKKEIWYKKYCPDKTKKDDKKANR